MRSKFLTALLLVTVLAGGAFAAIVVEKKSRQVPYVEVIDGEEIHSFIFRGPKGTSERPILVPPREYWTAGEAGLYHFVLRDGNGHVCSRLVTPEVFARYRVGDDFNDCAPAVERSYTEDSKTVQPVVHHRKHTAQVHKRSRGSRPIAQHRRVRHSRSIAAR